MDRVNHAEGGWEGQNQSVPYMMSQRTILHKLVLLKTSRKKEEKTFDLFNARMPVWSCMVPYDLVWSPMNPHGPF